jgi:hypothetical protein
MRATIARKRRIPITEKELAKAVPARRRSENLGYFQPKWTWLIRAGLNRMQAKPVETALHRFDDCACDETVA